MCGITGFLHFDAERKAEYFRVKSMADTLIHRGPDGEGFYLKNNIALGHRRLAIIDLNTGNQPIYNHDKSIAIILNGEIYNYIEIREQLVKGGYKFSTQSDTEVFLKAYEKYGEQCLNLFNGMWACAIWDENKKQLFISRDRIGEKPLYYSTYDNTFIFGSEIKSIFKYGVPKINRLDLIEIYLVLNRIPAPHTFFKNIYKLKPGHFLIVNSQGIKELQYWDLPIIDQGNLISNENMIYEKFEHLFDDSVKIRMRADVSFGAFLSGGLDSSSVVANMYRYSALPIKTFTMGVEDSFYDERNLAKLVSAKFNTEHYEYIADPVDFFKSIELIVKHYDEPFGDSSALPTGQISNLARTRVKMALTGDGGDEVLSGYPSYQSIKLIEKYQRLPKTIKTILNFIKISKSLPLRGYPKYKINKINKFFETANHSYLTRTLLKMPNFDYSFINEISSSIKDKIRIDDYLEEFIKDFSHLDDFYKHMYFHLKLTLPEGMLVKVDRMSMAYSLETRIPFLDHRLVEFLMNVDKSIKMKNFESKSILRRTVGKRLPKKLLNASKKGFSIPVTNWFRSASLSPQLSELTNWDLFPNKNLITNIIKENSNGTMDHGNALWSLLVLKKVMNE